MLNTNAYKNMSSQDLHYFKKYIKYKQKYIQKKKMLRGGGTTDSRPKLYNELDIHELEFDDGELKDYNIQDETIQELEGYYHDTIHGKNVLTDETDEDDFIQVYLIPIIYSEEAAVYVSLSGDNIKDEWASITEKKIIKSKDLYIRGYGSKSPQVQYYNYKCKNDPKNCIRYDVKTIYNILKKIKEYFKENNIKTENIEDIKDFKDFETAKIIGDYEEYGKGLLNIDNLGDAATLVRLEEEIEIEKTFVDFDAALVGLEEEIKEDINPDDEEIEEIINPDPDDEEIEEIINPDPDPPPTGT